MTHVDPDKNRDKKIAEEIKDNVEEAFDVEPLSPKGAESGLGEHEKEKETDDRLPNPHLEQE